MKSMRDVNTTCDKYKETHPIVVVQGGFWGSEGKGMVAAALCEQRNIDFAVRTGAVNAGHTVYHHGKQFKMQQLPTGWVNPGTKLVVGAGAYISPEILKREIGWIAEEMKDEHGFSTTTGRLYIDRRAGLHLTEHTTRSTASDRHHLIGATGKGCSEAIVDKIKLRGNGGKLFVDWLRERQEGSADVMLNGYLTDTELMLNRAWDGGAKILIEGTQGQLLDLHLGPYPYTTHKQTGPANWLSEVGLSPNLPYEIALIVRTYPIRVAGNSGPMPRETSWEEVARKINQRHLLTVGEAYVNPEAIKEWEYQCKLMAESGKFELPIQITDMPNYQFHRWSELDRVQFKVAVSEFHKAVFEGLRPEVQQELKRVFEFTTVTNKLRRVAELDIRTLKDSIRQTRPNYLVVTFLNYLFPELWNKMEVKSNQAAMDWVEWLEDEVQVRVRYVSTGAESHHLIEL